MINKEEFNDQVMLELATVERIIAELFAKKDEAIKGIDYWNRQADALRVLNSRLKFEIKGKSFGIG
jgi:hypothetical protein